MLYFLPGKIKMKKNLYLLILVCLSFTLKTGCKNMYTATDEFYPTGYSNPFYESYDMGNGTTYYIDAVNGNDTTGTGSSDNPWKTLDKALFSVSSGDNILIRDGNYGTFQTLQPPSFLDWITIKNDNGHSPVFSKITIRYPEPTDCHIRFDGIRIHFYHDSTSGNDAVNLRNMENFELRNCTINGSDKYLSHRGIGIDHSENILIYHNEISRVLNAISVSNSTDITMSTNYIHGLGGGTCIQYAGNNTNFIIERNNMYDSNWNPNEPNAPVDPVHGSAISIRSSELLIRQNIIHYVGSSSGLMFYEIDAAGGEEFYNNIYIENNLIYDIQNYYILRIYNLGEYIEIKNNAFIGKIDDEAAWGTSKLHTAIAVHSIAGDLDGSGLSICNNILAGIVSIPGAAITRNNIIWSYYKRESPFDYECEPPDTGSKILTCSSDYPLDYFENNFFIETPDFTANHGQILDFHITNTCDAVNFGDPEEQPSTNSLGSTDLNGFIQDNGIMRDYNHHSAGCYEVN